MPFPKERVSILRSDCSLSGSASRLAAYTSRGSRPRFQVVPPSTCGAQCLTRPARNRCRVASNDAEHREAHRSPWLCRWASPRSIAARHHPTERLRVIAARPKMRARRRYPTEVESNHQLERPLGGRERSSPVPRAAFSPQEIWTVLVRSLWRLIVWDPVFDAVRARIVNPGVLVMMGFESSPLAATE